MKRFVFLAAAFVFAALSQTWGSEPFPFVISFDAPDNITNIAKRLDAPAGKDGFVRVVDGHFATDKGRIRFWGTNTCFDANFQDKATADRMADRLARFGTNCVRLHHMDMFNLWGDNKTRMVFDPVQLDKLDYYVSALKKRGIYVNLNLHVSRSLDERDGFPPNINRPDFDKGVDNYYRPIIDANKKFAKDLLEHVNPYTGKAYKDEPAVAMIEINNENSIVCTWGGWGGLDQIRDPFLADLRKLWNAWLVEKYKDDAGIRKAWKARTEPLGDELLKHGDFADGYVPDWNGWAWESNDQIDAPISNVDGVLRMNVKKKGTVDWLPQLTSTGFAVKKDKLYTLEFKARANKDTPFNVGVRMNHEPWEDLGFDTTVSLSTDWKTFRQTLTPSRDDDNARIGFSSLREGTVYELDFVSLKPGGIVGLPKEQPIRDELLHNGEFSNSYVPNWDGWFWEVDDKVDAPISNSGDILRLDVKRKGDVDWHPQLNGGPFAVQGGKKYTLTLTAKASRATSASFSLRMNHEPWESLGFEEQIDLTTEWKTMKWTVLPDAGDAEARLTLGGLEEGVVYDIDSVSLRTGSDAEPEKESSLAAGTVPVIWKKDAGLYPKEAVDDFCDFLFDVEAKYWDEMYRFLKDEVKVNQPVTGTQLEYGSTHAQGKMDYCDYHAYWNHPEFPHTQWDMNDWFIRNRALVNSLDRDILGPAATKRVWGKPFTVSEYNHPQPNQFAAEGFPLLAAFGAFQDWDGIFPFAYSHSKDAEPRRITSFFDTSGNTVQTAHMIACKTLFDTMIEQETIVAPLTAAKEREIFKRDRHQYNLGFSGLGLNPALALRFRTAVDVSGKVKEIPQVPQLKVKPDQWFLDAADNKTKPDSWMRYDKFPEEGGTVSAITPRSGLFTGFPQMLKQLYFLEGGPNQAALRFEKKPNLGWATATLTRLDNDGEKGPKRYLFVVTGEMRNTDMKIESLDGNKITFGSRWGKEPVLCEGVAVKLLWKDLKPEKVRCWALDESGNRRQEVAVSGDLGTYLETKPEYKTIWYEIEIEK